MQRRRDQGQCEAHGTRLVGQRPKDKRSESLRLKTVLGGRVCVQPGFLRREFSNTGSVFSCSGRPKSN